MNTTEETVWSNSKVGLGIKDTFKVISIPISPSPSDSCTGDKLCTGPGLILSYSAGDEERVVPLRELLTTLNYKVWTCKLPVDNGSVPENRDVSNVLLNCQYYILLLTAGSATSGSVLDQLSLAKLAGKKICILSAVPVEEMLTNLPSPLMLLLASCHWIILQEEMGGNKDVLSGILPVCNTDSDVICYTQTHLVQKLTSFKVTHCKTQKRGGFWDRNFRNEKEVLLTTVVECLVSDYQFDYQTIVKDDKWVLDILKNWSFGLPGNVLSRDLYNLFVFPDGNKARRIEGPDVFWVRCKHSLTQHVTLVTVLGLHSTVRYGTIDHISSIQEVVVPLRKLLRSGDTTMRAVACICVGRCGSADDGALLVELLCDSDRLVRKSACSGLARLQCSNSVQELLRVWRNDTCVEVRTAALAALHELGDQDTIRNINSLNLLESELLELA